VPEDEGPGVDDADQTGDSLDSEQSA